jgi:anti-sigma factor RsiW
MLTPEHPHDERLSALASGDPGATDDTSLTEHLSSCARCTESVAELSALRASLAELPDLRPHRPLRLLPDVADAPSRADRIGGWARRLFAPAVAAGAALAMVGLVGTASPVLDDFALSGGTDSGAAELGELQRQGAPEEGASLIPAAGGAGAENVAQPSDGTVEDADQFSAADDDRRLSLEEAADESVPADPTPWPIVLVSGVAIMVAAALLRWAFATRAG